MMNHRLRLHAGTKLSSLNDGNGVQLRSGNDLAVTLQDGSTVNIDLGDASTLGDVLDAINAASPAKVSATISGDGNRLVLTDLTAGGLASKGSPSNRDTDADLTPDRLRFVLLAQNGVLGPILEVAFGVCAGAPAPAPSDFGCTLDQAVAPDGVTKLPTAACTIGVENTGP